MRTHPEITQTAKPLSEQQHLPVRTGLEPVASWAKALYRNPQRCATPAFLWNWWLLLQGRFCRFPQNGAFSRNFPGCLRRGNPDGYFSFFTQSGHARLS